MQANMSGKEMNLVNDIHVLVGNKFPPLPRKHNRNSLGTFHKKKKLSPGEFLITLKHHLNHN